MSSFFINGAKYALSRVLGPAVAVTAVSNGNPAVATAPTLPAQGDIVVFNSNWSELLGGIATKVGTSGSGTFELLEIDSTDLNRYPAGEGIGAYQVASSFVSLTQIRDFTSDGGEQNFFNYQYVDDPSSRERRKPTNKSAMGYTVVLDYDPNLPWYDAAIELDRKQEKVVLREILPTGDTVLYFGYMSFRKVPSKVVNENMTVQLTFSLDSDPIRIPA